MLLAVVFGLGGSLLLADEVSAVPSAPLTLAQYRETLDNWARYYEAAEGDPRCCDERPVGMPGEWRVVHQGQDFTISTDFTESRFDGEPKAANDPISLFKAQQEHASARRRLILDRLNALRSAADATTAAPEPDLRGASARAAAILARREFRKVRTPGTRESLSDRIKQWLLDLLRKLYDKTPDLRFASRVLAWSTVALGVLLLAILLRRILARETDEFHIPRGVGSSFVSAKPWQEWLREAHAAADRGDWKEAIHLGYWAGISSLEAGGAWKPDRARTPREYLLILPAQSTKHAPLKSVTALFERAWYAQRPASEADFRDLLGRLEAFGCR